MACFGLILLLCCISGSYLFTGGPWPPPGPRGGPEIGIGAPFYPPSKSPTPKLTKPCPPPSPCLNNGTCMGSKWIYKCTCPLEYAGKNCENDNPCLNKPCLNGGTCKADFSNPYSSRNYTCSCSFGYFGSNCEKENPCVGNRCLHLGICHKEFLPGTKRTCSCRFRYYGENCEKRSPCRYDNGRELCGFVPGTRCKDSPTAEDGYICLCPPSCIGRRCEKENPCFHGNPCPRNSRCVLEFGNTDTLGYKCLCNRNFFGENCTSLSPCVIGSKPCKNNGDCVPASNDKGYTCRCRYYYKGENCTEEPLCLRVKPCQNGGTCRHIPTPPPENGHEPRNYSCSCAWNYFGDHCEKKNPCLEKPCFNDGICTFKPRSTYGFQCSCRHNYVGFYCSEKNPCLDNSPCKNGGVCGLNTNQEPVCYCRGSYFGQNCTQRNPCLGTNPCRDGGRCTFMRYDPSGYICDCHYLGWFSGKNCTPGIGSFHGKNSTQGIGSFHGKNSTQGMATGYVSEKILCSRANPCQNGGLCSHRSVPSSSSRNYACICLADYYGDHCEHETFCSRGNLCLNGGKCWPNHGLEITRNYTCKCLDEYFGDHCEHETLCSRAKPCQNGGFCRHYSVRNFNSRNYTCDCQNDFTGDHCELVALCRRENPCQHGGTCRHKRYYNYIVNSRNYTCSCLPYYSGDNCEYESICITANPCQNGGRCTDMPRGFHGGSHSCECPPGYYGFNCEQRTLASMSLIYCTFENSCKELSFINTGEPYQWCVNDGSTATWDTGPDRDHTTGRGFYWFTEATRGSEGDETELRTTRLIAGSGQACVSFWYHMKGAHIGSLKVVYNQKDTVFEKSGAQGDDWQHQVVALPTNNQQEFRVSFIGVKGGPGGEGDIAIDDVILINGNCTLFGSDPGVLASLP